MREEEIIANDLINKFRPFVDSEVAGEDHFVFSLEQQTINAKKCALVAVKEIIAITSDRDYCGEVAKFLK